MIIHNFAMQQKDPYTFTIPEIASIKNITILMSTRAAGSMTYIPQEGNDIRNKWLVNHGIHPKTCCGLLLEHGKQIHTIDDSIKEFDGEHGDGMLLKAGSFFSACAITVADCIPIFIVTKSNDYIGVLHSGYKGTGILGSALSLLCNKLSYASDDITVVLGPHIKDCCYQVDKERAELFIKQYGNESVKINNGSYYLNLAQANIVIAEQFGLPELWIVDDCTSCNTVFGSYRREKPENFTRMIAVIAYSSEDAV